jgi:hypothetical protein
MKIHRVFDASRPMKQLALAVAVAFTLTGRAYAQAPSYGQYLVVIDDSGSMDESDPQRLAVLASMALAGALEDGDQVMLAGLNELASGSIPGPRFVSPRDLLPDRDGAEGTTALDGERAARIGTHGGGTPCHEALEHARTILEASASAGAPQTLLLLTDGACNGGAITPAETWLAGLRSHREQRFRFVLLMRTGRERLDPALERYGRATGWQGETRVSFDARTLLRAFAAVLSFSRGLRTDEGGRIGLERTFVGAREVRVLAVSESGAERIGLESVERGGTSAAITGGPTFRDATHGWSLRVARVRPEDEPFAVRSTTTGAEVLVVPVYGRLRVEGIIGACDAAPPLPWTTEVPVRAGQPACAYARLLGDEGASIDPVRSFDFGMDLCTDLTCAARTPMQPGEGGIFNAQLGASMETGRHEQVFRASGGALAADVIGQRGFMAMTFGVSRVERVSEDGTAATVAAIDLGELPREISDSLSLRYHGAFPTGARGSLACAVEGADALAACLRCTIDGGDDLTLSDGLTVSVRVEATPFCQPASEEGRVLPLRVALTLTSDSPEVPPHALPLRATLHYAALTPLTISVTGGESSAADVVVPGPLARTDVELRVDLDGDDPIVHVENATLHADASGTVTVPLIATADDCCAEGASHGTLVMRAGESELRVPLTVEAHAATFWVCPGKQIAEVIAGILLLLFLVWLVHGILSPPKFGDGAALLSASSLDQLVDMRDGDDGYRLLRRFPETKRGFRKPATLWLGGPDAPLPSLKRQPRDGKIVATHGGGATLVVLGPGVERWNESEGKFVEVEKGNHVLGSRVRLRRGEEIYLEFRR